jgi:hypothetical protein
MEYFAGLDISMAETQVCVVAQSGAVIHKAKVPSTPADIALELDHERIDPLLGRHRVLLRHLACMQQPLEGGISHVAMVFLPISRRAPPRSAVRPGEPGQADRLRPARWLHFLLAADPSAAGKACFVPAPPLRSARRGTKPGLRGR